MRIAQTSPAQKRAPARDWTEALAAGSAILARGESAVDAVEAAVRVLEEDPCFNAGRGSVLTAEGCIELDAAIMDGRTRRAGAVAGLRTTRAPISLARLLMEQGPHVFLSGRGADEFARGAGLEQVANSWFELPERRASWMSADRRRAFDDEVKYGTVGAVAVDLDGHVAAATSTGGTHRQALGPRRRFAADRRRHLRRRSLSGRIRDRLGRVFHSRGRGAPAGRAGAARRPIAAQALDDVLADIEALGGKGGLIAVAPDGEAAWGFTTPAMYRGMADATGRTVAIYADDEDGKAGPRRSHSISVATPARSVSRNSATASRKLRLGMKCAERVITGSYPRAILCSPCAPA